MTHTVLSSQKTERSINVVGRFVGLDHLDTKRRIHIPKGLYERYILSYLKRRLRKNQNCILIIHGDTGSGKSSASLRIAYDLDPLWQKAPELAPRFFIVFSAFEFLLLVRYLIELSTVDNNNSEKQKEIYRGRWIVFEEAGVGASHTLSGIVQEMRHIIEVFREYQINVIFNMPWAKYMKFMREEYAHLLVWCFYSDEKTRSVRSRVRVRYRREDEIIFTHPKFYELRIPNPEVPGMRIDIPWAPSEIWKPYKKEKWEFFRLTTIRSIKRSHRLAKRGTDLSANLVRPFYEKILKKTLKEK